MSQSNKYKVKIAKKNKYRLLHRIIGKIIVIFGIILYYPILNIQYYNLKHKYTKKELKGQYKSDLKEFWKGDLD